MTTVRADFYWNYKRLVSALNGGSASSFTTVLDDPRRSYGEVFAALAAADDEVCTLIGETEGHGFRPLFLIDIGGSSGISELDHGDTLPERLGPITQVKIKYTSDASEWHAGKFDKDLSLADIERWRGNAGSIYGANHNAASSSLSGFYIEIGDEIYFTGYRAKGKVALYTRASRDVTDGAMTSGSTTLSSATAAFTTADEGSGVLIDGAGASGVQLVTRLNTRSSATAVVLQDANASGGSISGKPVTIAKLQTPKSLENGLLAIAVENMVKRGDNPPFANQWMQLAENARQRIQRGEKTIPNVVMAQAA
jgi:hypothetical protein